LHYVGTAADIFVQAQVPYISAASSAFVTNVLQVTLVTRPAFQQRSHTKSVKTYPKNRS
jgi:hypothetical protein